MLSQWASRAFTILVLVFAVICFGPMAVAQTASPEITPRPSSAPDGPHPPAAAAASSVTAEPAPLNDADVAAGTDDDDSPDIPAFAHGQISERDYLQLRDEHVRALRGLNDLARLPQARSRAVRAMERQERALQQKSVQQRSATSGAQFSARDASIFSSPMWVSLGPDPIPNGQVQGSAVTPVAVSGRVTAIAVDPGNENIVYVGTAQGGLYRSVNGGATWLPLMDQALSLAIGALTLDPTDPSILFVGTGEGNFSFDSFFGVGLYIITSANSTTATPVLNGPFNAPTTSPNADGFTDVFTGRSITRILVNPADHNKILVSTASGFSGQSGDAKPGRPFRGVYASSNVFSGGPVPAPTFVRLTVQTGAADDSVTDMVMDPGSPNTVVVGVLGSSVAGSNDGGIWKTSNAWAATPTWTQNLVATGKTFTPSKTPVTKFAVSRSTGPSAATTFFAAFDETPTCSATATGRLRSSPDGSTWNDIAKAGGFCGGQCWYDMALAVNPTDATKIYLGGNAISGAGIGACRSGAMGISTNGGTSFTESDSSLHADSHVTVVSANNPMVVYTGNDGGIFRSNDAGLSWTSLNNPGFTATQFESLAVHPTDPRFTIGGTQDNGTEFLKPDGSPVGSWTRADFGDGGFSAIDQNALDTTNVTMYHTYFNMTGTQIGLAAVTSTTSAVDGGWSPLGCGSGFTANGINCSDSVLFYAPLALGPGNPNTVYFGTDRLYRSPDRGATMTAVSQAPVSGVPISAIGISPQNDNVRIVGMGEATRGAPSGKVFATTSGSSTMTEVTGPWTVEYIARAVIDPTSSTTAYITLDGYGTPNHVWKTTNLSETPNATTWASASGSGLTALPDVPVNAFAIDPSNHNSLYAGTDIGVYNSTDGGLTWNPYGTNLPRVAVLDLAITSGHLVRIATHGRGMWEAPAVVTTFSSSTALVATATTSTFGTPVTFKATVNTNGNPTVPTGTVSFLDGGSAIGAPANVNASGQAAFTTSTLAVAQHQITASYSGDAVYSASTSAAQSITINNAANADYAVSIPSGTASVRAGTTATYTINLFPSNGFTGSVSFTCSGVPSLAACTFTPASVALNGSGQGTTTLSISTVAPTVALPASNAGTRWWTDGGFAFGLGLLMVFGFNTKNRRRNRRSSLFAMLGLLALAFAMISCGGGSSTTTPHNPGTPAGSYTINLSASSGGITHTSTVTLTVQ